MLPPNLFYWFRIDNKHMTETWLDQALMDLACRSDFLCFPHFINPLVIFCCLRTLCVNILWFPHFYCSPCCFLFSQSSSQTSLLSLNCLKYSWWSNIASLFPVVQFLWHKKTACFLQYFIVQSLDHYTPVFCFLGCMFLPIITFF